MKCLKIVLSPSLSHGDQFHRVKNSPLITGIVDRIKINSEQLLPFSESELSHTFCKLHVKFTSVSFILAAIAHVWINLHPQQIMSFIQWKGSKSHVAKEISVRGRRRSRDEKGNQGVGDFRFINILQLFSIYFFFFNYFTRSFFFLYFFYPRHLPTPTPTTHDI